MLDILAVGAHPDDIEIGAAGFLIKAKKSGHKTGALILTRGEAGAFADSATRISEAKKAAEVLELDFFDIMDFKDTGLEDTFENASKIALIIRNLMPKVLLAPWHEDFHPDHTAASKLVDRASFVAGRGSDDRGLWEPRQILNFSLNFKNLKMPDFVIDITPEFEAKKKALMAHESQFAPILAGAEFLSRFYGTMYGSVYGEGFINKNPLKISNPLSLL